MVYFTEDLMLKGCILKDETAAKKCMVECVLTVSKGTKNTKKGCKMK